MTHPDWVLKFKQKGTLIMRRGDLYYLYRVTSKWDPEKKRARMKTGEYLGRITPDGCVILCNYIICMYIDICI